MSFLKKYAILLLSLVGVIALNVTVSYAADNEKQDFGFSVSPVFPKNQIDESAGYYHLAIKPEESQDITVTITSLQKDPLDIDVTVHDAITGSNGVINYSPEDPVLDESLKTPLTEIVKVKKEFETIHLKGYEEKRVTFSIAPPKQEFKGIKLGALNFTKKVKENEKGITNIQGYNIGMILTEDRTDFDVGGELTLKQVKAGLSNGYKAIKIDFQNPEPKVISKLAIQTKMIDKKTKKVVKEYDSQGLSMAPNSNFTFAVPWGIDPIPAGDYTMHIIATSRTDEWEWKEDFKIDAKTAGKLNKEGLNRYSITKNIMIMIYLLIGLTILLLLLKWKQLRGEKSGKK